MTRTFRHFVAVCSIVLLAVGAASSAHAADIRVQARLSSSATEVGEAVQFSIDIENARNRMLPPEVKVDGLQVIYRASSQSQQMQFGTAGTYTSTRLSLNYEVIPTREGSFTIPALTVVVDGKTLQTQPVALKVQKGAGRQGGQTGQRAAASTPAKAFAEIVLKKKNIYLGEAVPVEVRFLVDARIRMGDLSSFELTGDGFTAQKFPKFDQSQENRDGHTYRVITFRTVLTPSKAGKLTVGPCEIPFIAQMPQERRRQQGRSLLDSFFGDDDFFLGFLEAQRYKAIAPAVEINVKPLPTEGRPKDFAGAVGQFQFLGETSTNRVKAGEPVNMRLTVTGEGSFDRVQAPALVDKDGWQAYDASEKFEPNNEFKNSGTKSFELPVVPQRDHTQSPQFSFSFFDPVAGKYVTQVSKPTPLLVEGLSLAQPAPSTPQSDAPVAVRQPERKPDEPKAATDLIAPLSYELGESRDFRPLHRRPVFWMCHGAAGVIAFGLIAARLLRRDARQKQRFALERERDHLLRSLSSGRRQEDFFDRAARVLQLATACKTGTDPGCVDAAAAKSALAREDGLASEIDEIFDRRGALLYAGGGESGGEISSGDRARILVALEQACCQ